MARILSDGDANVPTSTPWYLNRAYTCARCGCQFTLEESDFIVSHGPFMGALLDQYMYWRKFATTATPGVIDPVTRGTNGFPNSYYPDQIYGPCPFYLCGYQNTYISPQYGAAHPADASGVNPTLTSTIQSYIAGGAVAVAFYVTSNALLVGVFLKADATAYALDASGGMATAMVRTDSTTLNPSYKFAIAQPGTKIAPADALALDATMYGYLTRLGFAII